MATMFLILPMGLAQKNLKMLAKMQEVNSCLLLLNLHHPLTLIEPTSLLPILNRTRMELKGQTVAWRIPIFIQLPKGICVYGQRMVKSQGIRLKWIKAGILCDRGSNIRHQISASINN